MADYHLLPKGPSKALESFPRKEGPCKEWKYPRNWVKPVMAYLDRVVSLIARGPLQIMEKVMVDSNFRRRSWWILICGEGHGGLPGKGEGRGGLHFIMGNGLAHRFDSPLWELRLDGPTGRTKLANHRHGTH